MESFSVATFNVHQWVDAKFENNLDRVTELVKVSAKFTENIFLHVSKWGLFQKHDPDIVCFQEATKVGHEDFQTKNQRFSHSVKHYGCSIFSKIPLVKNE